MMWFLFLLYTAHIERVFSQDDGNKMILRNGKSPCEGHVEIYHNRTWGFIADSKWNETIEKVVCRSTHCGEPMSTMYQLRPIGGKVWLDNIVCNGSENHLWDCENLGWDVSSSTKDYMRKITCSNEIKISLDGFKCAGTVKYSITSNGTTQSGYFCADGWGQKEAHHLCEHLGCGVSKGIPEGDWMVWKEFQSSVNMMIKCSGIEKIDHLWQCATTQEQNSCSNPAHVICTGHKRLQLRGEASNVCQGQLEIEEDDKWNPFSNIKAEVACRQMFCGGAASSSVNGSSMQLKCTENVTTVLMDNNQVSKCYGEVHIRLNAVNHPVCASTWTDKNAEVVCKELNCGKVVSKRNPQSAVRNGIMDNVRCYGNESSLWHCQAKRDNKPFSCSSKAYVICAGSLNVRLADGPGRCAGRVEIQYEGKWQNAMKQGWTDSNSNIVCKQLKCGNKRKAANVDKFSQGSGRFLQKAVNCLSDSINISDCIRENSPSRETLAVPLTCEEHKVVFLKGNVSCSGKVGIEYNSQIYWLSGSDKTWNRQTADTVCRQMLCGNSINHTSINKTDEDVWQTSYSCTSNSTSLFKCDNKTLPSNHSETIATVICSGNKTVELTEKCWGNVRVCVGSKCGGVCKNSWSDKKSEMLCNNLNCGKNLQATNHKASIPLMFMSLHTTKETTNLNQCNFVTSPEIGTTCNAGSAYVVCSGSVKAKMNDSRYECSGNVIINLENQWLPVCKDALESKTTQKAICRDKCGEPINTINYFGQKQAGALVISKIECAENAPLKACTFTSEKKECALGGLRCSEWRKMELKYSNKACSGAVFVHSKANREAVSIQGWTQTESQRLCQDLNCGNFESDSIIVSEDSFCPRRFSCEGVNKPENIWACEQGKEGNVSSQNHLYIECQDEPTITLSDTCGGEVRINNLAVCSSHWNLAYARIVCRELGCKDAVFIDQYNADPDVKYHHVSCEDYHHRLGQCSRYTGKCNGNLVSVYCVDYVKFQTTKHCGGQIEVNYRNKWEKVCPTQLTHKFKNQLCKNIGCEANNSSMKGVEKKVKVNLESKLDCSENHQLVEYCVSQKLCRQVEPATIYCNGYVNPRIPDKQTGISVYIILGVGFLLLLVILIVVYLRIYIVKKTKKPMTVSSRKLTRREVEFESGDYEDVTSKSYGTEDRFRSEAEVIREGDARSTSSFPYDDIDEAIESQPLTSQDVTADGATYEVEDPQESYDDIEASPEITHTSAEVHDSPQNTPESLAVAPPGLVRGDEDYLVPGEDG